MTLAEVARIALPAHPSDGEFDHAAVDATSDRLYVAHPSNDTVEVVDLARRAHVGSLEGLKGIAGVWVDRSARLLFTSNRGEDTASIIDLSGAVVTERHRVATGARPNGMAFDPSHGTLMVAGVGDQARVDAPPSATFIAVDSGKVLGRLRLPGRTRWALYHPPTKAFYVNIADPPQVLRIRPDAIDRVDRAYPAPAKGPHGLEQDGDGSSLYCACDDATLLRLDLRAGELVAIGALAGAPDVLWADSGRRRLYAAVGDPGVVEVFELGSGRHLERVATGPGAHTLTVDPRRSEVHVFLPQTCEDLVLTER